MRSLTRYLPVLPHGFLIDPSTGLSMDWSRIDCLFRSLQYDWVDLAPSTRTSIGHSLQNSKFRTQKWHSCSHYLDMIPCKAGHSLHTWALVCSHDVFPYSSLPFILVLRTPCSPQQSSVLFTLADFCSQWFPVICHDRFTYLHILYIAETGTGFNSGSHRRRHSLRLPPPLRYPVSWRIGGQRAFQRPSQWSHYPWQSKRRKSNSHSICDSLNAPTSIYRSWCIFSHRSATVIFPPTIVTELAHTHCDTDGCLESVRPSFSPTCLPRPILNGPTPYEFLDLLRCSEVRVFNNGSMRIVDEQSLSTGSGGFRTLVDRVCYLRDPPFGEHLSTTLTSVLLLSGLRTWIVVLPHNFLLSIIWSQSIPRLTSLLRDFSRV